MTRTAKDWIEALGLLPHPEGGYYREMLRSRDRINLPDGRERVCYTSIYFLLTNENPSRFHRLKSDEVWYFHAGAALTVHCLTPGGYDHIRLGPEPEHGEVLQACVPKGAVFGATVDAVGAFALVSCMVSPGFEFEDFELADQAELLAAHPRHHAIIRRLARRGSDAPGK
ncbi:cupin [Termitidicoccus mucosus]|uniref:Cupin n=1 Tax=Termitidicoccus mucosus TaxID=1184151 RepID=A0A178INX8_9BACT|nr:cupin [Opitutaceae bacterium TSB47]